MDLFQTGVLRADLKACSERTRCKVHLRRRNCRHRRDTGLDQSRYAAGQDQIGRIPKACLTEKTYDLPPSVVGPAIRHTAPEWPIPEKSFSLALRARSYHELRSA